MRFHKYFVVGALVTLFIADVALWTLILARPKHAEAALYFLDIGQGDSSLIVLPSGAKVLIDGGPDSSVVDRLEQVLPATDRYIDLVVMTHPQLDHFAGLVDVLKDYRVGAFLSAGRRGEIGAYQGLRDQLEARNVTYVQVLEGDRIKIGEAIFSVLGPSKQEILSGELNDSSVVLELKLPEFSALFTGDIAFNVEDRLLADYDLDVDVLKVGHHGSKYSSGEHFLAEVLPAVSVVSVGKNTYGHPTAAALSRLTKFSKKVLRTDQEGTVKIIFQNGKLELSALR